jgi:Domain of unknown function (DUF4352)
MSTPPSQHPSEDAPNPKAQAKAAKAYAKATRPWYKKKRVLVPAGIVALAIVGSNASSQNSGSDVTSGTAKAAESTATNVKSDTTATKSDTKAAKSDTKAAGSGDEVAKVGQAVTNAGTTYKVTDVNTAKEIGDPDLLGARADGTFVIVDLQLTNNKDETKTFMDSNAKIEASDGTEYETSDKAIMSFGDESLMLKDIQPDLTTQGKVAFEVPPNKASGSTLVIEDLWGSGEIKVDLGL